MLLAVLGVALAAAPARAFERLESARALGMVNALRASPSGAAALQLNPAGMSLAPNFTIEGNYAYGPQLGMHGANVALVDSTSGIKLAGGVQYSYLRAGPTDFATGIPLVREGHELAVGLAYPFSEHLSVGATGKYQKLALRPAERIRRRRIDRNHGNVDVGAILTFNPVRIGIAGLDLVNASDPDVPVLLGLSVALGGTGAPYLVGLDVALDFSTWGGTTARYSLGAEYVFRKFIAVRTGYSLDSGGAVRHYAGAGASLVGTKAALDIALRQQANLERETVLGFAVRIFVQ